MRLGKKISKLRRNKNMTQKELAEKVGISVSYLSKIERGDRLRPPMQMLSRIAHALGVKIKELRGR